MATEAADDDTHPFYKHGLPSLIGVLVSILLGYVVYSVAEVSHVLGGGVIGWVAVILIAVNVFRVAHGLIIAMSDTRYDTQVGGDFNIYDMAKCLLVLVMPFISLNFIVKVGPVVDPDANPDSMCVYCAAEQVGPVVDPDANPDRMKNFLLVLSYMLPHIVYLFWDIRLGYKLKWKGTTFLWRDSWPGRWKWTGDRPDKYVDWVPVWLGIDIIIIVVLVVLLFFSWGVRVGGDGAGEFLLRRNTLVVGFAILSAASMFFDYVWINRRYYFPR